MIRRTRIDHTRTYHTGKPVQAPFGVCEWCRRRGRLTRYALQLICSYCRRKNLYGRTPAR